MIEDVSTFVLRLTAVIVIFTLAMLVLVLILRLLLPMLATVVPLVIGACIGPAVAISILRYSMRHR